MSEEMLPVYLYYLVQYILFPYCNTICAFLLLIPLCILVSALLQNRIYNKLSPVHLKTSLISLCFEYQNNRVLHSIVHYLRIMLLLIKHNQFAQK